MNVEQLILKRRTIHSYTMQKIDTETVEKAIELACWAPNHRSTFPWRFLRVGDTTRKSLARLAIELKAAKEGGYLDEMKKKAIETQYLNPSDLLVILLPRNTDTVVNREDYASIAMGIQNMSLYLWEKSIGTKWSSGGNTNHPKVYQLLQVDESKNEIVGFFWMGHFEQSPAPKLRPQVKDILIYLP